ncbi:MULTISPECIES: DUF1778 domain-containing protein [unclassified Azospirillum]|uniref:type II toxin-antitoxin system TacA family antitoxin n=1 Tax=unclassified Azospirillum TaxID=2630922 RepID=UPI000B757821|nr:MULTISPECIES: DUF1778 domain-containing protein [unclassified Azospirillum]SNS30742.1 Uncharacterized conserved protein, DUF1778 family [Azospirillum sp. RU38E]SNS49164.1 Uncharacterized conserved protein, DUF1778 family [Azospirillum sp. RU37A]
MPNVTTPRTRAERLEARVTAEQKRLIEQAAALQGRSLTDFVLSSVQDAAKRTIEEHQRLELSLRDSEAFVEALLNPPAPNDRLRETVGRYRQAMGV